MVCELTQELENVSHDNFNPQFFYFFVEITYDFFLVSNFRNRVPLLLAWLVLNGMCKPSLQALNFIAGLTLELDSTYPPAVPSTNKIHDSIYGECVNSYFAHEMKRCFLPFQLLNFVQ